MSSKCLWEESHSGCGAKPSQLLGEGEKPASGTRRNHPRAVVPVVVRGAIVPHQCARQGRRGAVGDDEHRHGRDEQRAGACGGLERIDRWLEGLALLSHGRLIEGLDAYQKAEGFYERLGETENLAGIRALIAEALDYGGDFIAAERNRQLALTGLMQLGDSDRVPAILTEAADDAGKAGNVKWNFEKFLVGREGHVVRRFRSKVVPQDPRLVEAIESLL